ncbi:MAG: HDIG domain-containing protein [Chloroflexota bacterium]|nr:HDIG domain-containing protein [Chloroflexota bacterium]
MRERLLELIPEFDLIVDADLREKTIQTWEAALGESGWTPDALARMPFTLLINPCPASYIDHIRAVTLTAVRAAEVFAQIYGDRIPVNKDFLISGGLLHDIGKLLEYENRDDGVTVQTYAGKLLRHPFTGMELAARLGLPVEVQHIIAAHAGEGDKVIRTTEATLVNHADFMSFHSIKRMGQDKNLSAKMV